ncbi:MAG: LysM peptidoglycan-binding domain-containing protein [bacterium]
MIFSETIERSKSLPRDSREKTRGVRRTPTQERYLKAIAKAAKETQYRKFIEHAESKGFAQNGHFIAKSENYALNALERSWIAMGGRALAARIEYCLLKDLTGGITKEKATKAATTAAIAAFNLYAAPMLVSYLGFQIGGHIGQLTATSIYSLYKFKNLTGSLVRYDNKQKKFVTGELVHDIKDAYQKRELTRFLLLSSGVGAAFLAAETGLGEFGHHLMYLELLGMNFINQATREVRDLGIEEKTWLKNARIGESGITAAFLLSGALQRVQQVNQLKTLTKTFIRVSERQSSTFATSQTTGDTFHSQYSDVLDVSSLERETTTAIGTKEIVRENNIILGHNFGGDGQGAFEFTTEGKFGRGDHISFDGSDLHGEKTVLRIGSISTESAIQFYARATEMLDIQLSAELQQELENYRAGKLNDTNTLAHRLETLTQEALSKSNRSLLGSCDEHGGMKLVLLGDVQDLTEISDKNTYLEFSNTIFNGEKEMLHAGDRVAVDPNDSQEIAAVKAILTKYDIYRSPDGQKDIDQIAKDIATITYDQNPVTAEKLAASNAAAYSALAIYGFSHDESLVFGQKISLLCDLSQSSEALSNQAFDLAAREQTIVSNSEASLRLSIGDTSQTRALSIMIADKLLGEQENEITIADKASTIAYATGNFYNEGQAPDSSILAAIDLEKTLTYHSFSDAVDLINEHFHPTTAPTNTTIEAQAESKTGTIIVEADHQQAYSAALALLPNISEVSEKQDTAATIAKAYDPNSPINSKLSIEKTAAITDEIVRVSSEEESLIPAPDALVAASYLAPRITVATDIEARQEARVAAAQEVPKIIDTRAIVLESGVIPSQEGINYTLAITKEVVNTDKIREHDDSVKTAAAVVVLMAGGYSFNQAKESALQIASSIDLPGNLDIAIQQARESATALLIGNNPDHAETPLTVLTPPEQPIIKVIDGKYSVESGDSLWSIAQTQFGGIDYQQLLVNGRIPSDVNNIHSGDVVTIRPADFIQPDEPQPTYRVQNIDVAPTPGNISDATDVRSIDSPTKGTYIVGPNDTLSGISASFNVPVDALVHYNNISDPNLIREGQVIHIPTNGESTAPTVESTTFPLIEKTSTGEYNSERGTIVASTAITLLNNLVTNSNFYSFNNPALTYPNNTLSQEFLNTHPQYGSQQTYVSCEQFASLSVREIGDSISFAFTDNEPNNFGERYAGQFSKVTNKLDLKPGAIVFMSGPLVWHVGVYIGQGQIANSNNGTKILRLEKITLLAGYNIK